MRNWVPFNIYGETVFLSIQDAIIICLMWYYQSGVSTSEKGLMALVLLVYPAILLT